MSVNIFCKSSKNSENEIDTTLFVQKPYSKTIYLEIRAEEDIDMKN